MIPDAPHEVLLVLDGTTGQNGLEQAKRFTNGGGHRHHSYEARRYGQGWCRGAHCKGTQSADSLYRVGEKADDLLPFDATEFIHSIFKN